MGKGLGAAGRRAVCGSDPATGRVQAPPAVCAALVAAGLAVPHGRGGHHSYYLTTAGRRLREELEQSPGTSAQQPAEPAAPAPASGSFTADDGSGMLPPADPGRRAAEVAAAWEGLLQIRAVLLDGRTAVPAPWERERVVHAVALALEAAGCPPGRPASAGSAGVPGYRVAASPHPGAAEVAWSPGPSPGPSSGPSPGAAGRGAELLDRCAEVLAARGWQSTRHRTRAGEAYLLTTPANR
ncbi:hypothetical protein [Actinacidiphila acidipaludis]|uniref:Uncharacterized protein n=1 Tax=Actinacidiphila acidipaludis TaxID=2873382 RepID=A0ABS7Q6L2_9ACTN|nr:hypothetical protein [Streptomyces acidipaludis]MBY8878785.1 hypothetical protein [Streptomyces acidipaludis]